MIPVLCCIKIGHLSRIVAALLIPLLLSGCGVQAQPVVSASVVEAMSGPSDAGYARAVKPIDLSFPLDHGPHDGYRTEWWYYTGNLTDAEGNEYGYQLTFFRSALTPKQAARASTLASNQVYMAHFAIGDAAAGRHVSFDRYSRGAAGLAGGQGEPAFAVWLEDWSARQIEPGVVRLVAAEPGEAGPVALDLTLRETRPPVLHGERGLHQKGPEPGNASYYYSLVGLETTGTITTSRGSFEVSGLSWMDHEFGTSSLGGDATGWDWFSIQLDNGIALMLYGIRTTSGAEQELKATIAWPDGRQAVLTQDDFSIAPVATWTSPRTGITYPSAWEVAVPGHAITLAVEPMLEDQEMNVSFIYYEGAIRASGSMEGAPVSGRGFVELTGYGQSGAGDYQR